MRVVILGLFFIVYAAVSEAQPMYPDNYSVWRKKGQVDDPCSWLVVLPTRPMTSPDYDLVQSTTRPTRAEALVLRDQMLTETPGPQKPFGAYPFANACSKRWAVIRDRDNFYYMIDSSQQSGYFGTTMVKAGMCGRDASAMVRAQNQPPGGPGPAYNFDVCQAGVGSGGFQWTAAGQWMAIATPQLAAGNVLPPTGIGPAGAPGTGTPGSRPGSGAGLAKATPSPNVDPTGEWDSDWGPVTITARGGVSGYWIQNPTRKGVFTGGTYNPATRELVMRYSQDWNAREGEVRLTMSTDGSSMSGSWKQYHKGHFGDDAWSTGGGGWALTRSKR